MKTLLRPRLWIALLLGITAGLMVWTVCPWTCSTARLPTGTAWPDGRIPFHLIAISSDGRYFVTYGHHRDVEENERVTNRVYIWDRDHGFRETVIEFLPGPHRVRALFSPDERKLAVVVGATDFLHPPASVIGHGIYLYDLASRRLLRPLDKNEKQQPSEHVLFSHDGKLLHAKGPPISNVLHDLETGQEVRRLPPQLGGFEINDHYGEFAVYRKNRQDKEVKIYSWLTGELVATHDLIGNFMLIGRVSTDGQVIDAQGWSPGASPFSAAYMDVLLDASTGARNAVNNRTQRMLSPDGQVIAQFGEARRPDWPTKWGLFKESVPSVEIVHWQTGETLATIPHAKEVCFSPQGNQIAIVRDDAVIEVYELPLRTPWGLIGGAGFAAALGAWSIGWIWARWRKKKAAPATA